MQPEAAPSTPFLDAVSERLRLHEQCFMNRDAQPLLEQFLAAEPVWDFQGFPPLRGREAVLGFFKEVVQTSTVAITPIAWGSNGPMGWSLVDYLVRFDNDDPQMLLRTVFVWSRSEKGWLVELATGYKV